MTANQTDKSLMELRYPRSFLGLLLVGFLIWWMLQRQLSPLLATARTLASASDAKDRLQPLPIFREDEIGQLIGGFNQPAIALVALIAILHYPKPQASQS